MAVPWGQLLQWAPQIVGVARELLDRTRGTKSPPGPVRAADSSDLGARVAALEENERRQAELVERMAAQQAQLSKAVVTLHRNQWVLISVVVVLLGVVVWLASRG